MSYQISLENDDFVLLLDVLKKAQEEGLVLWSAAYMVCEHTQIIP